MTDVWLSADDIAAYPGVIRDSVYAWIAEKSMSAHKRQALEVSGHRGRRVGPERQRRFLGWRPAHWLDLSSPFGQVSAGILIDLSQPGKGDSHERLGRYVA